MGDFSAAWLALREPADRAARSDALARSVGDAARSRGRLRIVDLGAGTGSNVRYLARRLPAPQDWVLVDRDPALLAFAARAHVASDSTIETRAIDLSSADSAATRAVFDGAAVVTASALLDLVSRSWLTAVAALCDHVRADALFALTYDGRIEWAPGEQGDELVRAMVNVHQRRDKGFGPALGPSAPAAARDAFAALGYRVRRQQSDWDLAAADGELQRELIEGWTRAAAEIASPGDCRRISSWRRRRLAHVDAGRSRLRVGHEDIAAVRA